MLGLVLDLMGDGGALVRRSVRYEGLLHVCKITRFDDVTDVCMHGGRKCYTFLLGLRCFESRWEWWMNQ